MTDHDTAVASGRRTVLQSMTVLPIAALLAQTREALAQATGGSTTTTGPVRVDTKGLTARIKFEHVTRVRSRTSTASTSCGSRN